MNGIDRANEITRLNQLSEQEVRNKAGSHLIVMSDIEELHMFFADNMCQQILHNRDIGRATVWILPFGPVGQYPYFIERVNRERISLADVKFYFMDEYCDIYGVELPMEHPLSFRGKLYAMFSKIDKKLLPDMSNIIFPLPENIGQLKESIATEHLCVTYGGVGIHGHLAFNEPAVGVRDSDPRVVQLNDYTVTINAIREGVGGNLERFPRQALTLGMNQLFSAEKMIIFCRNGVAEIDWANTVLRLALLGTPGDDYPVTYLKEHNDWLVITDKETLKRPISI